MDTPIPARAGTVAPTHPERTAQTVIRPPASWPGFGLREVWRFRSICVVLARRTLMARYRQTLLGAAWTVLQPLLLMLVFTVFFGLFARSPSQGLPWAVFYLLALVPWQIVSRLLNEGGQSIVMNSSLVGRVYFPRVYYPGSVAIASLVDFLFGLVALAAVLLIFRTIPTIGLVLVPLFTAVAIAFGLGMALWLSALNATYRDVAQLLPALTQLLFFTSPILYPSAVVPPHLQTIYHLNPMASVIDVFRWGFAGAPAPDLKACLVGIGSALFILVSGYVFFRRRESTFADVI
jgi:lipopolysaccharide transport system permease protein